MTIFIAPRNRNELAQALSSIGDGAGKTILAAGCTDLLASHPSPIKSADTVISLLECQDLRTIQQISIDNTPYLQIGSTCTHSTIAASHLVQTLIPALCQSCSDIGSAQIRNRGTIGGSLVNASAAGDIYPVLLACHGMAEILDSHGLTRYVSADDLILGPGKTCLASDEVLLSVLFPIESHTHSVFQKLGERSHVSIAKLSLCISFQVISGQIQHFCAVIGAAGPKAFIARESSAYVNGLSTEQFLDSEHLETLSSLLSKSICDSIPDRASLPYKMKAIRGLVFQLADTLQLQ